VFRFLKDLGNYEERKVANTELDDGTVIDTAAVSDSARPYETGVQSPFYHGGKWVIVELYDTKGEAEAGHARWVDVMRGKPVALEDVTECELEQLAQALGGTCRGTYARKELDVSDEAQPEEA
jgi:hypothetical protein